MIEILIISLLIWLPVLFYAISRRAFVLVLGWLLVAPIVMYGVDRIGGASLVEVGAREGARSEGGGYVAAETNVRARDLLNPTRLLFTGILVVFLLETALKRRRLGRFDATEKFACLFAVILIASAVFQSNRTLFGLRSAFDAFLVPFISYFCVRRLVKTDDDLRRLFQVLMYMGVYLIVIGLIDRFTSSGLYTHVQGPFGHRNELYLAMAAVFFVALIESIRASRVRNRIKSLSSLVPRFILCLAPVIILLGWGRGNLLGFLLALGVFLFLGRRLVNSSKIMGTVGLLLVLLPTVAIGIFEVIPEEIFEERIHRASTVYARMGAWQIITDEIARAPIRGIGFNNLRDILHDQRIFLEGVRSENHAHNSFLALWAELGLIGLLAYLAIGISIVRTALILYHRRNLQERWLGVALIAVIIAYWVPAFFNGSLYASSLTHVYVYVILGGIIGVHVRGPSRSTFSETRTVSRGMPTRIGVQQKQSA